MSRCLSTLLLQMPQGESKLYSVYVPTNHVYVGDIFLLTSEDIIKPHLSVREGLEIVVSVGKNLLASDLGLPLRLMYHVSLPRVAHQLLPDNDHQ